MTFLLSFKFGDIYTGKTVGSTSTDIYDFYTHANTLRTLELINTIGHILTRVSDINDVRLLKIIIGYEKGDVIYYHDAIS